MQELAAMVRCQGISFFAVMVFVLSYLVYLGTTPHPVTVTTRIITSLVGNPYKPSFATVTGGGRSKLYLLFPVSFGTVCGFLIGFSKLTLSVGLNLDLPRWEPRWKSKPFTGGWFSIASQLRAMYLTTTRWDCYCSWMRPSHLLSNQLSWCHW